jgi:septal ring factor EnvC (AmiA/AmiB activator)
VQYYDPVLGHLDEVLRAAHAVLLIVDDLEAVPSQVQTMQREIEGLQNQIKLAQAALRSEKTAWENERRQHLEERRHDFLVSSGLEQELAAELADAKAKLRALHDEIAARKDEFEALAKATNRLERHHPTYPT